MTITSALDRTIRVLRAADRFASRVEAATWLLRGKGVIHGVHLGGLHIRSGDVFVSRCVLDPKPTPRPTTCPTQVRMPDGKVLAL